ncbi:MAG TPA: hypothetical protein VI998_04095 [Patescibacteria group bacterium]|nr:hypothetical protein [Patescibacteria group bacterium]
MKWNPPKNDDKFYWTRHVADKMRYYGISESLIKRIIRYPKRLEEGVAPDTFAGMAPAGSPKRPQEIWVMYQKNAKRKTKSAKLIVISAWRYLGKSPIREKIPIPQDVLGEIEAVMKELKMDNEL